MVDEIELRVREQLASFVAVDHELAERIRRRLALLPEVGEARMFSGLGFLVNDKLAVFVATPGSLWLRCAPERAEELRRRGAEPVEAQGGSGPGPGWLAVAGELVGSDDTLGFWVDAAVDYTRR